MGLGPQETVVLQQVALGQACFVVGIRHPCKHIPAPISKTNQHLGGYRFSFMLSKENNHILPKLVPDLLVIGPIMDEEILTLTGELQETVVRLKISLTAGLTYHDPHALGLADIIPPAFSEMSEKLFKIGTQIQDPAPPGMDRD